MSTLAPPTFAMGTPPPPVVGAPGVDTGFVYYLQWRALSASNNDGPPIVDRDAGRRPVSPGSLESPDSDSSVDQQGMAPSTGVSVDESYTWHNVDPLSRRGSHESSGAVTASGESASASASASAIGDTRASVESEGSVAEAGAGSAYGSGMYGADARWLRFAGIVHGRKRNYATGQPALASNGGDSAELPAKPDAGSAPAKPSDVTTLVTTPAGVVMGPSTQLHDGERYLDDSDGAWDSPSSQLPSPPRRANKSRADDTAQGAAGGTRRCSDAEESNEPEGGDSATAMTGAVTSHTWRDRVSDASPRAMARCAEVLAAIGSGMPQLQLLSGLSRWRRYTHYRLARRLQLVVADTYCHRRMLEQCFSRLRWWRSLMIEARRDREVGARRTQLEVKVTRRRKSDALHDWELWTAMTRAYRGAAVLGDQAVMRRRIRAWRRWVDMARLYELLADVHFARRWFEVWRDGSRERRRGRLESLGRGFSRWVELTGDALIGTDPKLWPRGMI